MTSASGVPAPRQVGTWQDAEVLARDWLRYFGHTDAKLTSPGADGGVDVVSSSALAQVKFKAQQVGAPDLQRLYGARASAAHKSLFFFSGTSYSAKARTYADENGVALFTYTLSGGVEGANMIAVAVLQQAEARGAPAAHTASTENEMDRGPGSPASRVPVSSGKGISRLAAFTRNTPRPGLLGLWSAVILLLPATLTLVGFSAAAAGAKHTDVALTLGIVGGCAYFIGVSGVAFSTYRARMAWRRPWGSLLVAAIAALPVTIWTILTIDFMQKAPTRVPLVLLACMTLPLVAVALSKPS